MASSNDIPLSEEDKTRFKLLDAIYVLSKGYKFTPIPTGRLFDELSARTDKEKQGVKDNFEYLRKAGLVRWASIGNVSIKHNGIKEFGNTILKPDVPATSFPLHVSEVLTKELRGLMREDIETIQRQRRVCWAAYPKQWAMAQELRNDTHHRPLCS